MSTLLLALALAPLAQEPAAAPTPAVNAVDAFLDPALREEWIEYVLPTESELGFESVPWIASFGNGMREAQASGRPMLLWMMNGHPLGCT